MSWCGQSDSERQCCNSIKFYWLWFRKNQTQVPSKHFIWNSLLGGGVCMPILTEFAKFLISSFRTSAMSFQPQPYQPQYVPPYEDHTNSQAQSRSFKMLQGLMSNDGLYFTFMRIIWAIASQILNVFHSWMSSWHFFCIENMVNMLLTECCWISLFLLYT